MDEPVLVTVLSDEQPVAIEGRVLDLSGRGLKIAFSAPVRIGAAIKIERPGEMWLGEVIYIRRSAAAYQIGIEIDQALRYTQDLERLRDAVGSFQQVPVAYVAADEHR